MKIVAVAYNTLALSLMTQTDIRSMADLKGKRLGILTFRQQYGFWYALSA